MTLLGPYLTSLQLPSLHPVAQLLRYTSRSHSQYLAAQPLPKQSLPAGAVPVGELGQSAPHETIVGQLFAETVHSSPLSLQMPSDAPSAVEVVQLHVPQQFLDSVSVIGPSHALPPHVACPGTRDLIRICTRFVQALQALHSPHGPHSQSVGGCVPVVPRL